MTPKTAEDIIYQYCMGMLNPNPDYYAGRGNSVHDLNSSILEMLYGGISAEIGADAAKAFVNMVRDLKNTNAQSFLKDLYRLEKKGWVWSDPVMRVRVATATVMPPDAAEENAEAPAKAPPRRIVTEILNAFTRSGSLYGHDKSITQAFLERHKAEIESSLFSSSFGGAP